MPYPDIYAGQRITASLLDGLRPAFVAKTANETVNNSTTLQNDDELLLPVVAYGEYILDGYVRYLSNTTADIKWGWAYPLSSSMDWATRGLGTAATGVSDVINTQNQSISSTPSNGGSSVTTATRMTGYLRISATAGNFQLMWAQSTANASDSQVFSGSWLSLTRVA